MKEKGRRKGKKRRSKRGKKESEMGTVTIEERDGLGKGSSIGKGGRVLGKREG